MKNNMVDTSDYSDLNQFGMPLVNKKVPGKIKDQCNGHKVKSIIVGQV